MKKQFAMIIVIMLVVCFIPVFGSTLDLPEDNTPDDMQKAIEEAIDSWTNREGGVSQEDSKAETDISEEAKTDAAEESEADTSEEAKTGAAEGSETDTSEKAKTVAPSAAADDIAASGAETAVPAEDTEKTPAGTGNSSGKNDTGTPETDVNKDGEKEQQNNSGGLIVYVTAGLAVLAAAAAAILLMKNKKEKKSELPDETGPVPEPPVKSGILMRLEVLEGTLSMGDTYYLDRELIIGCDPRQCDIVFVGDELSPRHMRIFRRDGMICLEDLGTESGTYLGGVRLLSSRRLRSGDEIMVGNAVFIIWF